MKDIGIGGTCQTKYFILALIIGSLASAINAVAPAVTISEAEVFATVSYSDGRVDKIRSKVQPDPLGSDEFTLFVRRFEKNRVFTFNNDTITITFKCTAPYRVTWGHTQDIWLSRSTDSWLEKLSSQTIFYERTVGDIEDLSTYQYTSYLRLYNQKYDTGEYICQSAREVTSGGGWEKISIFQAWYGGQVSFPLAKKTVSIWLNETKDGDVVLPCYVRNSATTVTLLKKSVLKNKWDPVLEQNHIRFVPELGFIYSKKDLLKPGIYKCTVGNNDDKYVVISLLSGDKPKPAYEAQQIISTTASFTETLNETDNLATIKCCSSTSKAPVLTAVSCRNRDECDRQLKFNPTLVFISGRIIFCRTINLNFIKNSLMIYVENHFKLCCSTTNRQLPANLYHASVSPATPCVVQR